MNFIDHNPNKGRGTKGKWIGSQITQATISNDTASKGLLNSLSTGTTTISAYLGEITAITIGIIRDAEIDICDNNSNIITPFNNNRKKRWCRRNRRSFRSCHRRRWKYTSISRSSRGRNVSCRCRIYRRNMCWLNITNKYNIHLEIIMEITILYYDIFNN